MDADLYGLVVGLGAFRWRLYCAHLERPYNPRIPDRRDCRANVFFSIFWFGVFGSIGFYAALNTELPILDIVRQDASRVAFFVLEQFPASTLTVSAVIVAAFLFLVTSVVSAAFVLGMLSSNGALNPSRTVKLGWGVVLGALGLVMILSDNIATVKAIIALGALPFVFVITILVVCLIRALLVDTTSTRQEDNA